MKPNPIALVIDPDKAARRWLRTLLESQHYRLFESETGQRGLAKARVCQPDVIILELYVPDMSGMTVLKRLRLSAKTPVLVLSTLNREVDIVAALDGGANDYMIKPFSEAELLSRLRVLRRCIPSEFENPVLVEGDLELDVTRHLFTLSGRKIDLTPTEGALLHALAAYAGMVVSCQWLLRSVWGAEGQNHWQYLRVFISSLRKKLEWTQGRIAIETLDRLGYRLWLRSGDRVHDEDMFPHVTTELQNGESRNLWRLPCRA
jgi:two-component system KDP operon response regulator KdpE